MSRFSLAILQVPCTQTPDCGLKQDCSCSLFSLSFHQLQGQFGYAAWKGWPKNFNREMYWTAFAAAIGVSAFLMVFAHRMEADVRTWQYLAQLACFGLAALLFGVAGGCMVGVFTYRRGVGNQDPPR